MKRAVRGWSYSIALISIVAFTLSACGNDSSGSSSGSMGSGIAGSGSSNAGSGSGTAGPSSGTEGSGSSSANNGGVPSGSSNVTLSWQPPTENSDGSQLADLRGYTIHYGKTSQSYTASIEVSNPGLTRYVVDGLPKGTYYFAVSAYNSAGLESQLSSEVSGLVN